MASQILVSIREVSKLVLDGETLTKSLPYGMH
jgi:hypothetical protein